MNTTLTNAFPTTPMQDKFGQIVFPMAGLSKLEYFALEMWKEIYRSEGEERNDFGCILIAIEYAQEFLEELEKETKEIQNEKDNNLAIVQS
jgi:hypothetical protein